MVYQIRTARVADAESVLGVYAPYVADTTVSFELAVPDAAEYAGRIAEAIEHYAFLVVERVDDAGRHVAGFASYGPFGHRAAYQWSAEISIYLEANATGRGVGSELLRCLEDVMRAGGITNSEACICSENNGSIDFHMRHGYRFAGEFDQCASKFGRWLGIQWLEKHLADHAENPDPPKAPDPGAVESAILAANARLARLP